MSEEIRLGEKSKSSITAPLNSEEYYLHVSSLIHENRTEFKRRRRTTVHQSSLYGEQRSIPQKTIAKDVVSIALPTAGCRIGAFLHHLITTMVVGQKLGLEELVALGLGNAMINILFITTITGIGIAVQNLIRIQNHHGHEEDDRAKIGIYVWRGRLLLTFAMLVLAPFLVASDKILISTGQDPKVAEMAASYIRMTLPAQYLWSLIELERHAIEAYPQVWGKRIRNVLLQLTSPFIYFGMLYLLVIKLHMGFPGIATAYFSTFLLVLVVQNRLLTAHLEYHRSLDYENIRLFDVWNKEELLNLMRISLPHCFSWFIMYMIYDIFILIAGQFSIESQACVVIIVVYIRSWFTIPFGFQAAAEQLVGRQVMIVGSPRRAKRYFTAILFFAFGVWAKQIFTLVGAALFIYKGFTPNKEVAKIGQAPAFIVVLIIVFNFWQALFSGALRAIGREDTSVTFSFVFFFVIAFPLSIYLSFFYQHYVEVDKDKGESLWLSTPPSALAGTGNSTASNEEEDVVMVSKTGLGELGLWVALAIAQGLHLFVLIIVSRTLDWHKHVNNLNFRDKDLEGEDIHQLWASRAMQRRKSRRELRRTSGISADAPRRELEQSGEKEPRKKSRTKSRNRGTHTAIN